MKIIVNGDSAVYIDRLYYPSDKVIEIKDEFDETVKKYAYKKLVNILDEEKIKVKFEIVEDEIPKEQCQAITATGERCKLLAMAGSKYCRLRAHQKLNEKL